MTALAANFPRKRVGDNVLNPLRLSMGLAASTRIYQGALVALNQAGNLVPASADNTLFVVGVAEEEQNNSSGAADALSLVPRRGCFPFTNSAGIDAITVADVGRACYVVDDTTVARGRAATGIRPQAGIVAGIDASGGVLVEVGTQTRDENGNCDILLRAGADLSTTGQNRFVSLDSSGQIVLAATAGMVAAGVLLNAPASAAIGIVRRRGLCRVLCEDTSAEGVLVAVAVTTGRAKTALRATCDASGASATAALTGSFIMGQMLEESSGAGDLALMDVHPMGCAPGTLA
jgi:hypothetical protein